MTSIVSLVPSSTETLLALGADVVACTRFCEQPGLTTVGGTKNPDIDAIVALAPDVVVMDVEENRREDAEALQARGLRVEATDVRSVADALRAVETLASIAGVPLDESWSSSATRAVAGDAGGGADGARGHDGSGRPGGRVGADRRGDRGDPPWAAKQRRALVVIWRRPWMALGHGTYGASLLAHLGIDVVVPTAAGKYPTIELDDPSLSPQLVLAPSEPYPFKPAHLDELRAAFGDADVVEVDGQDLFWWGSRTPAAIDRLGGALGVTGPGARRAAGQ